MCRYEGCAVGMCGRYAVEEAEASRQRGSGSGNWWKCQKLARQVHRNARVALSVWNRNSNGLGPADRWGTLSSSMAMALAWSRIWAQRSRLATISLRQDHESLRPTQIRPVQMMPHRVSIRRGQPLHTYEAGIFNLSRSYLLAAYTPYSMLLIEQLCSLTNSPVEAAHEGVSTPPSPIRRAPERATCLGTYREGKCPKTRGDG